MTELVFIDSGVLIAAATGRDHVANEARRVLLDPEIEFASTQFVWLEVLPKAQYTGRLQEVRFYKRYFDSVTAWADVDMDLLEDAAAIAAKHGLSAVDAIHVAAALGLDAKRLITTERKSKPLHRVTEIQVTTIHPGAE